MLKSPCAFVIWPPASSSQLPSACQSLPAALCQPPQPAILLCNPPGAPRPAGHNSSPCSHPVSKAEPAPFPSTRRESRGRGLGAAARPSPSALRRPRAEQEQERLCLAQSQPGARRGAPGPAASPALWGLLSGLAGGTEGGEVASLCHFPRAGHRGSWHQLCPFPSVPVMPAVPWGAGPGSPALAQGLLCTRNRDMDLHQLSGTRRASWRALKETLEQINYLNYFNFFFF